MNAKRCLVCGQDSTTVKDLHNSVLSHQINIISLLRNLLEIPKEVLEKCFRHSDGENPAEWFSICDNGCRALVEKAGSIFQEFYRARQRLKKCQKKLQEKIRVSNAKVACGGIGVQEMVWDSVLNKAEDIPIPESCDVTVGDDMAAQLLAFKLANQNRSNPAEKVPKTSLLQPKEECDDLLTAEDNNDFEIAHSPISLTFKHEAITLELDNESENEFSLDATNAQPLTAVKIKCPQCPKSWETTESLKRHLIRIHPRGDKIHPCNQCDKSFNSSSRLQSHKQENHRQRKVVQCPHCQFSTDRSQHLTRHIKVMHEKTQIYPCEFCGKQYNLPENLRYHQASNHNKCSVKDCGVVRKSPADLREHQVTYHGREVDLFRCSKCGLLCKTKYFLRDHQTNVHGKSESKTEFPCSHCDKVCVTQKRLKSHIYDVHTLHKEVKCPYCDYVGKRKSRTDVHIAMKHEKEGRFVCGLCQRRFKLPELLRHHQVSVHNQCTVKNCRVVYKDKLELRNHQVSIHGKEINVFQCSDCIKLFIKWHLLSQHSVKVHGKKIEKRVTQEEDSDNAILGM